MKRVRLTMSQALVQFLDNQYIECDGVESKFVSGIFGIFGHGCVVGVGQALEQGAPGSLPAWQELSAVTTVLRSPTRRSWHPPEPSVNM